MQGRVLGFLALAVLSVSAIAQQPATPVEKQAVQVHTLEHGWQVFSVAYSPDGKLLASGSADETACLWDAKTGRLVSSLSPPTQRIAAYVQTVIFSPDGKSLYTLCEGQVQLWDIQTKTIKRTFTLKEGTLGRAMCLALSPDGKTLAMGGSYPFGGRLGSGPVPIWLWDTQTGELKKTLDQTDGAEVVSLSFSPDGKTLAGGTQSGSIALWDTSEWKIRVKLSAHSGPAWAIAFSPDGKTMATGGHDNLVHLYDPQAGVMIAALPKHDHIVLSLAFSPDGKMLASGSYDNNFRIWNTKSQALIDKESMGGWVHALAFSPDSKSLAVGIHAKEKAIRLWNLSTNTQ